MYYESCLETWKKEGDLYNTAATLNNLALVYYLAEEHESSIKIYEEVGRIDRELGLRAEEIETRVNIGSSWRELKQYDKALQELQAALEMYEALGTDDKKASTQLKIVHVLIELKHFEEAEILCYSTLELEEKIGRKNQLGMIYGQLGYLHAQPTFENYNPTKSLDFYEKGVSLCEEIDASQYEHYIRKNYAVLLEHLGHFKEALYQVKRSYEIQTAVDKDKLKISLQASTLTALRQNTEDIQSSQSKVTILEDLVQEKQQALLAAERELEQWKAQAVPDQAESSGVEYSSQYYNNIVVVCIGVYGYDSGTPNDSSIVPQHQRYSNIIAEIYHLAEFHDMDIIQVVGNTFLVCAGIPDAGIASFEKVASFASSVLTFIERGSSEKTLPESTENASSAGVKIGAHYGAIIVDSITEYQTQYNLRGTTVDIVRQIQEQSELGQINASEGFAHKVYSQFTVTKYNEIAVVNAENTPERIKTFTIGEI
jgi:tetratricopeptide (TPR) repeat protein